MLKKTKKRIMALAALSFIAAVGVTLAFMFKKANAVNTFTPAVVSCTVHEKLDNTDVTNESAIGDKKSDIRVQNTGNVNEYLRLRMVSYFVDKDGNISGAEPSVFPNITLKEDWIAGEEHTYYYTKPVAPNGYTTILCEPFELSEIETRSGKLYQVVEVFAEAIQAEPVGAAKDEWGAEITNDGIITKAR